MLKKEISLLSIYHFGWNVSSNVIFKIDLTLAGDRSKDDRWYDRVNEMILNVNPGVWLNNVISSSLLAWLNGKRGSGIDGCSSIVRRESIVSICPCLVACCWHAVKICTMSIWNYSPISVKQIDLKEAILYSKVLRPTKDKKIIWKYNLFPKSSFKNRVSNNNFSIQISLWVITWRI